MNIKILVASHKKYRMPKNKMYLPIQVGAEKNESIGFQGDNTGENISNANPRMCELTAIYWAWKNLNADYIGLVHYRRHFTTKNKLQRFFCKDKFDLILSQKELEPVLDNYDLVLPNKRKYYIESMKSHFVHLPYTFEKDFNVLRETVIEIAPDYKEAFDKVMNRSWAHMFNMFIMKKKYFDNYCEWLFHVLTAVDKKVDVSNYTIMEARTVAYFGEFMMDVWNEKNRIPYKEMDVMFMERQNWLAKSWKFLIRKFKYKREQ